MVFVYWFLTGSDSVIDILDIFDVMDSVDLYMAAHSLSKT